MSRVLNLNLSANETIKRCDAADVGVSVVEEIPAGGVRLVCMSSDGAELMRKKLKSNLMKNEPVREIWRPSSTLW